MRAEREGLKTVVRYDRGILHQDQEKLEKMCANLAKVGRSKCKLEFWIG